VTAAGTLAVERCVRESVANTLGLLEDEVFLDASLVDDYGADDTDIAVILRSLSAATGVAFRLPQLRAHLRGPLRDDEFQDGAGLVTRQGLAHLGRALGLVTFSRPRQARRILSLVTVGDLVALFTAAALRAA
jgi:hypothetical protein